MRSFTYLQLNERRQEIRLLELYPGGEKDPITGQLTTVSTLEKSPTYEALSYVWGSPDDPGYIILHDNTNFAQQEDDGTSTLSISRNLCNAMPYLRHPDNVRRLWIDAICINQIDLEERASQVQRMHSIFKNAQRTVLWMGVDPGCAQPTFDKLLQISSSWQYDPETRMLSATPEGKTVATVGEVLLCCI